MTAQMWVVKIGNMVVMRVMADNEAAARIEADRQLNRPGRYEIRSQWIAAGSVVVEMTADIAAIKTRKLNAERSKQVDHWC